MLMKSMKKAMRRRHGRQICECWCIVLAYIYITARTLARELIFSICVAHVHTPISLYIRARMRFTLQFGAKKTKSNLTHDVAETASAQILRAMIGVCIQTLRCFRGGLCSTGSEKQPVILEIAAKYLAYEAFCKNVSLFIPSISG